MAHYTYNWGRSHFQPLPIISTLGFTAARENMKSKRVARVIEPRKKKSTPIFGLCACTKLKYSTFWHLILGKSICLVQKIDLTVKNGFLLVHVSLEGVKDTQISLKWSSVCVLRGLITSDRLLGNDETNMVVLGAFTANLWGQILVTRLRVNSLLGVSSNHFGASNSVT